MPPAADNFRPYLTSFQGNSFTDYINAVFVDVSLFINIFEQRPFIQATAIHSPLSFGR